VIDITDVQLPKGETRLRLAAAPRRLRSQPSAINASWINKWTWRWARSAAPAASYNVYATASCLDLLSAVDHT